MAPDDSVGTMGKEPPGHLFLLFVGLDGILYAPMNQCNGKIGATLMRNLQITQHFRGIDKVDDIGFHGGNTIGAISIGEQCQTYAVTFHHQWVFFVVPGTVAVGAEVWDTQAVENAEGAFQAVAASVHAVVVGRSHDVETRLFGTGSQRIGSRELGIAAVGLAVEWHLEVDNGQVGALNIRLDVAEAGRIVVAAVGLLGSVDLRHVTHQVAGKDNLHTLSLHIGTKRKQQ